MLDIALNILIERQTDVKKSYVLSQEHKLSLSGTSWIPKGGIQTELGDSQVWWNVRRICCLGEDCIQSRQGYDRDVNAEKIKFTKCPLTRIVRRSFTEIGRKKECVCVCSSEALSEPVLEPWFAWTHITTPYRHREQGILPQVHPHHSNRTVPNTTSTPQEMTYVCPRQRKVRQGRGSWPPHRPGWQELEVHNRTSCMSQGLRNCVKRWPHSCSLCDLTTYNHRTWIGQWKFFTWHRFRTNSVKRRSGAFWKVTVNENENENGWKVTDNENENENDSILVWQSCPPWPSCLWLKVVFFLKAGDPISYVSTGVLYVFPTVNIGQNRSVGSTLPTWSKKVHGFPLPNIWSLSRLK